MYCVRDQTTDNAFQLSNLEIFFRNQKPLSKKNLDDILLTVQMNVLEYVVSMSK